MSLFSMLPAPAARLSLPVVLLLTLPAVLGCSRTGAEITDAETADTTTLAPGPSSAAPAAPAPEAPASTTPTAASSGTGSSGTASSGIASSGSTTGPAFDPPRDLSDAPSLGRGFVVWESSRGGAWRLWTRPLDGSGPARPLTDAEPGRAHCCAHVAPDGSRLVYLSLPRGQERYPRQGAQGVLRLLPLERAADGGVTAGGPARDLGPARTYFEHRAAVWRDDDRLIMIDGGGRTRELDLSRLDRSRPSSASAPPGRVLVERPADRHGWLIDPTLRWASQGSPTFSIYAPDRRAVVERPNVGGCQPYFTGDGRWGVWIAGAGGPLRAFDPETRTERTILAKSDPRLPARSRYLYFPMPSRDSLFLAFGASDGEHDHQKADYEIFVVETDPETLDVVGPVRRVTRNPATDRFPDVWAEPLALGRHVGEAPLTVRFEAAGDAAWTVGGRPVGARAKAHEHTFSAVGQHAVTARLGDGTTLRGTVRVRAAAPPRLLAADVRRDGREILLQFDEPVRVGGATATLVDDRGQRDRRLRGSLSDDAHSWSLRVDGAPITGPATVVLDGVTDRAEPPNRLASTRRALDPPRWPSRRDDLVLLWHTGDRTNTVDGPDGRERATLFERQGRAWLDRHHRMVLRGGAYLAEMETMQRLFEGARASNELTLEVTVTPEQARVDGRATIFTFSSGTSRRNFTLAQEGDRYTWRLNTPTTGDNGDRPVVDVGRVDAGKVRAGTPQHLVISYRPGRLDAWLDGERTAESTALQAGFFHWREMPLLAGREWEDQLPWRGTLEALAVYARPLDVDEARENGRRLAAERSARDEPRRLVVRARLRQRSEPPTLQSIAPYRDALAVYEYDVEEVVEGRWNRPRLRVAHRVLVDGATMPITRLQPGRSLRLELEPLAGHEELEPLVLADDLGTAGGLEIWTTDRIEP